MAEHNQLGEKGEDLALDFLLKQGYELLARNYRYQKAEVDIILNQGNTIIFVEVKTRTSESFVEAEVAVTTQKQKRMISAANNFLTETSMDYEAQFDIVVVILNSKEKSIRHIPDAFNSVL